MRYKGIATSGIAYSHHIGRESAVLSCGNCVFDRNRWNSHSNSLLWGTTTALQTPGNSAFLWTSSSSSCSKALSVRGGESRSHSGDKWNPKANANAKSKSKSKELSEPVSPCAKTPQRDYSSTASKKKSAKTTSPSDSAKTATATATTSTSTSTSSNTSSNTSSSTSSSTSSNTTTSSASASAPPPPTSTIGTGTSRTYPVSVGTEQGFRSYMEDEFYVSKNGDFAAVFDGHGGGKVSRYLRKNLYANVQAFLPAVAREESEPDDEPNTNTQAETINNSHTKNNIKNNIDKSDNRSETDTISLSSTSSLSTSSLSISSLSISSSTAPRRPTIDDCANALESALTKVDGEILKISHWSFQGSTALVCWFHEEPPVGGSVDEPAGDSKSSSSSSSGSNTSSNTGIGNSSTGTPTTTQRTLLAANIGDSRAVLCRDHKAWDLSRDHKPNDPTERERIERLGGSVVWCGETTPDTGTPIPGKGIYRVNGNLALSRAIGDRSERPHVTAEPEIVSVPIDPERDEFVILGTDGLWDVFESDEAVECVKISIRAGVARTDVARVLVEEAMRLGTWDNVTVVVIWID